MSEEAIAARPIATTERVQSIDIVRGFALLGIFIMNMPTFASSPWAGGDGSHAFPAIWDRVAETGRDVLFSGKFNSMFSLLFGVGFTIQLGRLDERLGAKAKWIYCRRLAVLLVFGLIHSFVFWVGDVLQIYAVLGFLLLALRRVPDRVVMFLIALGLLYSPAVSTYRLFTVTPAEVERLIAFTQGMVATNDAALGHGGFGDALREHVHETFASYSTWLFWVGFWVQMLTTLLLGFLIGRHRLFQDASKHLAQIKKVQYGTLVVGVFFAILYGVAITLNKRPMQPSLLGTVGTASYVWCRPCIMIFYVTTLVRMSQLPVWQQRFSPIAAVGRMPLTNYLLQTAMGTTIFYHWGFGLWNRVGPAAGLGLAIALYVIVQIPLSVLWLRRFQFGPMEYVWRTLTYGKAPTLRRAPAEGVVTAAP